jgi:hypothetical protein
MYGQPYNAGAAWRLCHLLAEDWREADLAYEEVDATIRSMVQHCRTLSRHIWGSTLLMSVQVALAGCRPIPARMVERPESWPADVEGFVGTLKDDDQDASYQCRRRMLFLQQAEYCGFPIHQYLQA